VLPNRAALAAQALRLSPDLGDARIHANLGIALQRENKPVEAFACFRQAVELAPDDAEMWQYLASAHVADEDCAAAIPCCKRVVALKPDWAQGHAELGWVLQEDGRPSEAAACYHRALELEPDRVDSNLKLGGLYEELGAMADYRSLLADLFAHLDKTVSYL
jgi:protein O-GlcNAc transferase